MHPPPIHRAHDRRKVRAARFLMEALGENLLGTFQSFGAAELPTRRWIRIVEPLNTTPRKCSNFYCFAGHKRPPLLNYDEKYNFVR